MYKQKIKQYLIVTFLSGFGTLGILVVNDADISSLISVEESPKPVIQKIEPIKVDPTMFDTLLVKLTSTPKSLKINAHSITLPIVPVSVDPNGKLETPDWSSAGWFENGALLGEKGNVIINAHYDTNTGHPAGFYNLKNVQEGDIVTVVDNYNKPIQYEVVSIESVKVNDPSRLDKLNSTVDDYTLTLITCGGYWDMGPGSTHLPT
jgi:LPXTG-site transpeptidase (sortase) family protein